jgi:hypothetical protein
MNVYPPRFCCSVGVVNAEPSTGRAADSVVQNFVDSFDLCSLKSGFRCDCECKQKDILRQAPKDVLILCSPFMLRGRSLCRFGRVPFLIAFGLNPDHAHLRREHGREPMDPADEREWPAAHFVINASNILAKHSQAQ